MLTVFKHRRTFWLTWLAVTAWCLALGASLVWNLQYVKQQVMNMAYTEARASLDQDLALRRWVNGHGGVYVPVTENQQPVSWLGHIPEREVTTTGGRRLTLVSPADILTQMTNSPAAANGVRKWSTGLKYLNPENMPDIWEKSQLEAFAREEIREAWTVAKLEGKPYLRHMRAVFMEPGCEKCHAILGYKTGDLRGAAGVDVPLAPYYAQIDNAQRNLEISHGLIWLAGLAGIGFSSHSARRRKQQEQQEAAQRAQTEKRYRTIFEQARDGILIIDTETMGIVEFNTVAHAQLGYSAAEFAVMKIPDFEALESPEDTVRHIETIRRQGWDNFETRHRHKDGSIRDVQVIVQLLVIDDRPVLHCTFRDITERKTAEAQLHLYAKIFNHSGEAIMVTDGNNNIVAVNPAFTQLTGYTPEEVLGLNPRILASGRTPPETYRTMWQSLGSTGFWQGELWDRAKNGSIYPKWAIISAVGQEQGGISHYIASFTDISERKASEERIDFLAHHDPLTELPNRLSLENRLGQSLLSAERNGKQVAVVFIDMDRFKVINDTLGHHVGDLLLVEVAHRLRKVVRESDIVARLGGDEFVVALTNMSAAGDAAPVANKILQSLGQPYFIDDNILHSSPSMGISVYPDDGRDSGTLMRNADTAMYHAKEKGRNNLQFFTATMNAAARERLTLERDLRSALREEHLVLHYQPKIATESGEISGFEALVRWHHPSRGLISPLTFIPIAEESGLIEPLGLWVLNEACRQLTAWRSSGAGNIRMAVNLSAHQLRSHHLVDEVRTVLQRYDLKEGDLELEITESAAMENPESAIGQLRALRQLGVHLSIDDFGTGYSSLAYLKLLPIQNLKLDRTFVRDIETDSNDAAISAATLALAHSLGLKVVAEGVETEAQLLFLTQHRCDYLQGFLLGRPEPGSFWNQSWQSRPDFSSGSHATET